MSRFSSRHAEEESEIDLTPMLDVVFIMLIFFIVTASFIKEAGIEINRPESNKASNPSDSPNIVFQVTANNEIWLEGRRTDIRSVRANIERMHAEQPQAAVIIQAHKNANAETYAGIADYAREAGVYDVSLATMAEKK
jgi:biopolymer transport protein ExbD